MSNSPSRRKSKSLPSERVKEAHKAAESRNRLFWIFGAVVLVIALVAVFAFAAGDPENKEGGGSSASGGTVVPSGDLDFGTVEVSGTPLATFDGSPDPAIGEAVPGVVGQSFDCQPVTIDNDGTAKVVIFLAHWCPHCQKEVPRLVEWLEANGMPDDVDLYAVATGTSDEALNFPPGNWLRREDWPVPTLVDDEQQTAARAYGLAGYPYLVAVDADGNVVMRTSGEQTVEQWEALLDAARTGTGSSGSVGAETSPAEG